MKKFWKVLKVVTLISAALFILNMAVVYVFFGFNVMNPVKRDPAQSGNQYSSIVGRRDNAGPDNERAEIKPSPDIQKSGTEESDTGNIPGTPGEETEYFMTSAEVSCLKDLSLAEKLAALNIIAKISREEADKILDIAGDGVTYTEMEGIRAMLEQYLSGEEIERLMEILGKKPDDGLR